MGRYRRYRVCVPRTPGDTRRARGRVIDFVIALVISLAFVAWGVMR